MFLRTRPTDGAVLGFLASQQSQPSSYSEIGASRLVAPDGYDVDHNRIRLDEGRETFAKAVAALRHWKMFEMGWVEVAPKDVPIAERSCVAILVRHFGLWSLNASRIVYVIEDHGAPERFGFAYGTLLGTSSRVKKGSAWNIMRMITRSGTTCSPFPGRDMCSRDSDIRLAAGCKNDSSEIR
jgi:uncharacterized protein (UPF0548 family)